MTEEQQKEQFSRAYVRAVAAAARVNIYEPEVDDDSVDIGFAVRSVIGRPQKEGDQGGPPTGPVTILAFIDGAPRRVTVPLATEDHRLAIQAYESGVPVAYTGNLINSGTNIHCKIREVLR